MFHCATKVVPVEMDKKESYSLGEKRLNEFSDSSLVPFGCPGGSLQEPRSCRLGFRFALTLVQ